MFDHNPNEEDYYIIPHNYQDNGKILGIFEKQSAYLAIGWVVPMSFLNFKLLPISIDVKIFVEILLVIPPGLIALIGIGGDTLIDFVKYVWRYYKNAKVYYYQK